METKISEKLHGFQFKKASDQSYLNFDSEKLVYGSQEVNLALIYGYIFRYADGLRAKQHGDGSTPLHLAIKGCNFSATKFLKQRCLHLEQGQQLNIKNSEGDSIFDLFASKVHSPGMVSTK